MTGCIAARVAWDSGVRALLQPRKTEQDPQPVNAVKSCISCCCTCSAMDSLATAHVGGFLECRTYPYMRSGLLLDLHVNLLLLLLGLATPGTRKIQQPLGTGLSPKIFRLLLPLLLQGILAGKHARSGIRLRTSSCQVCLPLLQLFVQQPAQMFFAGVGASIRCTVELLRPDVALLLFLYHLHSLTMPLRNKANEHRLRRQGEEQKRKAQHKGAGQRSERSRTMPRGWADQRPAPKPQFEKTMHQSMHQSGVRE